MHTILGAGGAIGTGLVEELSMHGLPVRLVSRTPEQVKGAKEVVSADLSNSDATISAVAGSSVVYLLVGLKYELKTWRELWPRIMNNTIEACKRARARLVFFDNVYMYGKVEGPMTEVTPFNPCSKKGEIRAAIVTTLLSEIRDGNIVAIVARSADFYGPGIRTGVSNILVFDKLAKGSKAGWLVNDSVKHSMTFTPDAVKSLVLLAQRESAWNQTWHVPTALNPPTGKEFISMAAGALDVKPAYRVFNKPMLRLAGLFDPTVREGYEMLYQSDSEYIFDSTKFTKEFNFVPTSYIEGVRIVANACKKSLAG